MPPAQLQAIPFEEKNTSLLDRLHALRDPDALSGILSQLRFAALSINLAGRQRMLLQKVCKEFFMVLADVDAVASRRLMRKSVSAFETSLQVLIKNAEKDMLPPEKASVLLMALHDIEKSWADFSVVLRKTAEGTELPSRKEISYVVERNGQILADIEKLVEVYENLAYQLHT